MHYSDPHCDSRVAGPHQHGTEPQHSHPCMHTQRVQWASMFHMREVENQARLNLAVRNRVWWPLGVLTGRRWPCLSRPGCGPGVCSLCDYIITRGALDLGSCLSITIEKQHRRLSVMSSQDTAGSAQPPAPRGPLSDVPGSPLLRVALLCSNS